MGTGYSLKCNTCLYSVETSGPWEFYRDEKGRRHVFGHPVPVSEKAVQRGIYGLFEEVYCPTCEKVVKAILVEFKEPCRDPLQMWSGQCEPMDEYKKESAVKCPKCRNKYLILEPDNDHPPSCPKCEKGTLIGFEAWIS